MRIIAGKKRGMKLQSPGSDLSRPILDRVKESLYSVLYQYALPAEATVADLFCGVGSLGLEALSRGAEFVTFVERDTKISAVLEKNIAKAGFVEETKVITANAFQLGAAPARGQGKYDLVFVDPPYPLTRDVGPDSQLAGLMNLLERQVTDQALVSVRTDKKVDLLKQYGRFERLDRRVWGSMAVCLLRLRPTGPTGAGDAAGEPSFLDEVDFDQQAQ